MLVLKKMGDTMMRRSMRILLVAAVPVLLTACESSKDVVDAVNPVKWFEGSDADKAAENTEPKPVPGAGGPYPQLGAVPEAPEEPSIKREYMKLSDVLAADRENALYTDEVIRREAPPVRMSAAALPTAVPEEPPTATSITPPPESSAPAPAPKPAPAPAPLAAAPTPAPTTPAPTPAPTAAPAPSAAPKPAPAPQPLTSSSAGTAPVQPSTPPPSAAPIAQQTASVAAAPTATQMIATIYFPSGGETLTERDRGILRQVAQIYQRDGGKRVVIVGHSSQSGVQGSQSEQALVNYKVSLDRAASVGQALVDAGIPLDDIVVDARGSKELKYSEETEAGEAGNRRAEIFLQY